MCIAFAKNGYCDKDSECQYAHGPQDLRPMGGPNGSMGPPSMVPPPGMMGGMRPPMGGGSGGPSGNQSNYKTSMCKNMTEQGYCSHGESCVFAHSSSELRAKKPTFKNDAGWDMGGAGVFNKRKRDNNKTVLCQNYTTYGECQYGEKCNFAHGPEELAMHKKQRF